MTTHPYRPASTLGSGAGPSFELTPYDFGRRCFGPGLHAPRGHSIALATAAMLGGGARVSRQRLPSPAPSGAMLHVAHTP